MSSDRLRVHVWSAMARHFLDTETRPDLAITGLACVEAGLDVGEARAVFLDDVAPALRFNLAEPAGEWAEWDEAWVEQQIEEARLRRGRRRSILPAGLRRWLQERSMGGELKAIGACMELLAEQAVPERRKQLAHDLRALGCYYFDRTSIESERLDDPARTRLRSLFPEPFTAAMRPALFEGDEEAAKDRVEAFLVAPPS